MIRAIAFALFLIATPALADWHGHGHWGWHGGEDAASSFWGGFAGSILGGLLQPPPIVVAPSVPELQPWSGPWYAYCAQRYRTFDAHTGSYIGFDGQPHFCNA